MLTEKVNTVTLSILEEATAYNQWIFDKVKPWLGKGILEVGCGIGNLTGLLLQAGKVVVSDMNPHYLQRVEDKFGSHSNLSGVLLWDIRQDLPKNLPLSIDTILCSNVLEHVGDDEAVLSWFYRFLPQGGRLVLLVPALRLLYNTFDRELGHFRRYTKRELIQKLERNHFHICSLKYFNFFGILGWFVNGTLLRRERFAGRIARSSVEARQMQPIETTRQLAELIAGACLFGKNTSIRLHAVFKRSVFSLIRSWKISPPCCTLIEL